MEFDGRFVIKYNFHYLYWDSHSDANFELFLNLSILWRVGLELNKLVSNSNNVTVNDRFSYTQLYTAISIFIVIEIPGNERLLLTAALAW